MAKTQSDSRPRHRLSCLHRPSCLQCSCTVLITASVPVEQPEQVKLSRSSRRPTVPAGQRPAAQCYMLSRASSNHGRPSMEAKTTQSRPRRRSTGGATWLITRYGLRIKVHNPRNYDVTTANHNSKKFGKFFEIKRMLHLN